MRHARLPAIVWIQPLNDQSHHDLKKIWRKWHLGLDWHARSTSVPFSFQHSPMSRSVFPPHHMLSSPISEITSPTVTPARFPSPSPYPLSDLCRWQTWFSCFTFHLRVPWHIGILSEIHTLSWYGFIHCVTTGSPRRSVSTLDKGQYVPKLSHCQCEAKTTNIFT